MINPLNSPWNKPKRVIIQDQRLYFRWKAVSKHLTTQPTIQEHNSLLEISGVAYIAKNSSKMRLISHLDWVHYDPKDLAQAIDSATIDSYYERQLSDSKTDPNQWKRTDEEHQLKSYYAARIGRASLL